MSLNIEDLRVASFEGAHRIFVTEGVMHRFLEFADRINYQAQSEAMIRLCSLLKQAALIDPPIGSILFEDFPSLSSEPTYLIGQKFLFRVVEEGSGYRVVSVRLAPEALRVSLEYPEKAPWLIRMVFTHHALQRFSERLARLQGSPPKNPERTAIRLLAVSSETKLSEKVRVERFLRNGCKEAKYYFSQGWRFVIVESDRKFVILTIERSF